MVSPLMWRQWEIRQYTHKYRHLKFELIKLLKLEASYSHVVKHSQYCSKEEESFSYLSDYKLCYVAFGSDRSLSPLPQVSACVLNSHSYNRQMGIA